MIADNPVFGVGPGNFKVRFPRYRTPDYATYGVTHNTLNAESEYLETFAELGVVGGLCFLALVGTVLLLGFRALRQQTDRDDRMFLAGCLCGLVGLLMHNAVCVNMRWPTSAFFFWLFLGLVVGYSTRTFRLGDWPVLWKCRWALRVGVVVVIGLMAVGARKLTWDWYQSETLTMTGSLQNAQGRWQPAVESLRQALLRNPANCRAYYYLAHAQFGQKDFAGAEATYRRLQQYSPDYAQVHYNLAAVYLNQGRWEEAAGEYAIQRKLGGLPGDLHFDELLQALRAKGNNDEKYVRSLEQLLAINPADPLANNMLGNFHFEKGDYDRAQANYEIILRDDPGNVPALNNLAGVYFVHKDYAKARDACLVLTRIDPREPAAWRNLGKAHYMLGQPDEARRAWLKAEELEPGRADVKDFLKMVGGGATPSGASQPK